MLPTAAAEILRRVHAEPVEIEELVELASSDPAIAARVLSRANSAHFGGVVPVETLHDAVVRLGTVQTTATVTAQALKLILPPSSDLPVIDAGWKHSIACAKVCELTAGEFGVSPTAAYTAGLLHDVGRLALIARYPNEYSELDLIVSKDEAFDPIECERRLFEIDHCQAGDILVTDWKLPEKLRSSITDHHQDPQLGDGSLLRAVRVSCAVSSSIGYPEPSRAGVSSGDENLAQSMIEPQRRRSRIQAEIESEFQRLLHG